MKKLLMILPLALILCFMVSCQHKEAIVELETFKAQAEIEEQNKDLTKQYYTELDKTNIEELDTFVDKFISPDFVLHLPGGVDIRGKKGIKDYYAGSKMAFPDASHTVDDVIAEGNKVAFRATTKGTHQGEFMGIQPSGNDIKVTFDGFCQIQEGKIVEWWSEYDALGMMMQLGMELKPKEVE